MLLERFDEIVLVVGIVIIQRFDLMTYQSPTTVSTMTMAETLVGKTRLQA